MAKSNGRGVRQLAAPADSFVVFMSGRRPPVRPDAPAVNDVCEGCVQYFGKLSNAVRECDRFVAIGPLECASAEVWLNGELCVYQAGAEGEPLPLNMLFPSQLGHYVWTEQAPVWSEDDAEACLLARRWQPPAARV